MYNKRVLQTAVKQLGKAKAPKKPKDIIVDPMGQWKHPGEVTRIPSSDITMQGVNYPVMGVPNIGMPVMMIPGQDYNFPNADYVDEYPQMQEGGPYTTTLSPEEELQFQKFYNTLPDNLQTDDASYDIRGYWDSEGRPAEFDYSQPKEEDGYYHAYSINANTGKYLKAPWHPTFQHAVDEDRKIGWRPTVNVKGEVIATENPALTEDYIEADLTPEEIQEYAKGGYIIEDISVPTLTKFQNK